MTVQPSVPPGFGPMGWAELRRLAPGLALAAVIGGAASGLGLVLPVVGAPVFAIALGVLLAPLATRLTWNVAQGGQFAAKYVLQVAIILFGTGLSISAVLRIGATSLPVMLGTLAICLGMAWGVGRLLGVDGELRTLIGAGTGICGASAIGAVAPVLGASEAAVGYAMSTIFVFNVLGVLTFPLLGHLLGLSAHQFGLWAGTAINDTSSVTAAGYAYGHAAGDYAVVVKLVRALTIIPVTVAVCLLSQRRGVGGRDAERPRFLRLVPVFLPLFLFAAVANSAGLVPTAAHGALAAAATFAVAMAMAGIGLRMRPRELRGVGPRPLLLGAILSVTVAAAGLGLQTLLI